MRTDHPLWIFLVTLAMLLAGCASLAEESATIPSPEPGQRFTYTSYPAGGPYEQGPAIHVEVQENATRLARNLTLETGPHLRYTLGEPSKANTLDRFRETLNEDGHVVQRVAECAWPRANERSDCRLDWVLVAFGWGNEPGALGASTTWGNALTPSSAEPIPLEDVANQFHAEASELAPFTSADACYLLNEPGSQAPGDEIDTLGPLAINRTVLCDGLSLPLAFQRADGTAYALTHTTLDQAHTPTSNPPTNYQAPSPSFHAWERPLLAADATLTTGFPVPEAHGQATNQSNQYAAFLEDYPDAIVADTAYREYGGGNALGAMDDHDYIRTLRAIAPNGDGIEIEITKTVTTTAGATGASAPTDTTEYTIEGVTTFQRTLMTPTLDTLHNDRIELEDAVAIGEALTGDEKGNSHPQELSTHFRTHLWFPGEANPSRDNGYTIYTDHPGYYPQGSIQETNTRYTSVIDGPTGDVYWVNTNRSVMPLDGSQFAS